MNLNLSGRRALVCGSTQGIGRASAIELAKLGANVTLMARSEEKLQAVLAVLENNGSQQHTYLVADFEHSGQVKEVIEKYTAQTTVHILVNNTGGPAAGLAVHAKHEEFVKAFSNHLLCNHILMQACVEGMKREKFGRIINIISTSVKIPLKNLGVSNTIRGAVANWAKTLSVELAPFGITVNNVLPGATMTGRLEAIINNQASKSGKSFEESKEEMVREIPVGRIGEAHEVAAAVAFLASPAAAYINGINLPVDGGRTGSL